MSIVQGCGRGLRRANLAVRCVPLLANGVSIDFLSRDTLEQIDVSHLSSNNIQMYVRTYLTSCRADSK